MADSAPDSTLPSPFLIPLKHSISALTPTFLTLPSETPDTTPTLIELNGRLRFLLLDSDGINDVKRNELNSFPLSLLC